MLFALPELLCKSPEKAETLPIAGEVAAESATEDILLISRGFVILREIRLEKKGVLSPRKETGEKGQLAPSRRGSLRWRKKPPEGRKVERASAKLRLDHGKKAVYEC